MFDEQQSIYHQQINMQCTNVSASHIALDPIAFCKNLHACSGSKDLRFPWQEDSEGTISKKPVSHRFHYIIAGDEAVRAGSVLIHVSRHSGAHLALHGEVAMELPKADSSHNECATNVNDVVFRDHPTLQNHSR